MNDDKPNPVRTLACFVIGIAVIIGAAMLTNQAQAPLKPAPDAQANEKAEPTSVPAAPTVKVDGEKFPTGYVPNLGGTNDFLRKLDRSGTPSDFKHAAPEIMRGKHGRVGDKDAVLLYVYLYYVCPDWLVGRQGIGDCVSWGWAHACELLSAVAKFHGQNGKWYHVATEAIYGGARVQASGVSRAGFSDGSYGGAAAKWVKGWGVLFRRDYDGIDLSTYDKSRAKQWGNSGVPESLVPLAKEHPVQSVAIVANFEEAAAAIENGYPVPVCSGQGFSTRRDKDGFAAPQGSWSHCMCFIGMRRGARPGLLCLNSWGPDWISGPKWPPERPTRFENNPDECLRLPSMTFASLRKQAGFDHEPQRPFADLLAQAGADEPIPPPQPDGSFWVDASVATRMLVGRDSFAISEYKGFPVRKLEHFKGW